MAIGEVSSSLRIEKEEGFFRIAVLQSHGTDLCGLLQSYRPCLVPSQPHIQGKEPRCIGGINDQGYKVEKHYRESQETRL